MQDEESVLVQNSAPAKPVERAMFQKFIDNPPEDIHLLVMSEATLVTVLGRLEQAGNESVPASKAEIEQRAKLEPQGIKLASDDRMPYGFLAAYDKFGMIIRTYRL